MFSFRSEQIPGKPKTPDECKQALREIYKDCGWETQTILSYLDGSDDFYFDSVSQIRLDSWHQGRVALIGDAASCTSFLAGEGTGMAIFKAYILAGELQQANGDYQKALLGYEDKLRGYLQRKQNSAEKMVSFFAPKSAMQKWLIQSAIKVSSMPFLAKMQLKMALKANIPVPEYR